MSILISDRSIYKLMDIEGDWQLFAEYSGTIGNSKPINYIIQNPSRKRRDGGPVVHTYKTYSSALNNFNRLKYT